MAMIKQVLVLCIIIASSCCSFSDKNANEEYYVAGTMEYSPQITVVSAQSNVQNNLKAYLEYISLAKSKNVDILVFPEATLNYYGLGDRKALLEHALSIPDPEQKIAPCDHIGNYSEVLKLISKAAKDYRIYVLINIVEKVSCNEHPQNCMPSKNTHHDGYSLYNTNIVFDRYGRIISRYRKVNLYIEPHMDEPLTQPSPIFRTDFNVQFGHFICFDIMYDKPAMKLVREENVTNILYSSMWFSDLPFLTANQFHQAWAFANNVNLISSGASNPGIGSTGSGIFIGRKGIAEIITSPKAIRKLYTAKVPKDNSAPKQTSKPQVHSASEMLNLHLSEFFAGHGAPMFDIENGTQTVCAYDNICCSFEIKKKDRPVPPGKLAYRYALAVNYTASLYGLTRITGEMYCAVLSCTGKSSTTCGRRFKNDNIFQATEFEQIKIRAKVRSNSFKDILVMPNTLNSNILPLNTAEYTFSTSEIYKDSKHNYKDFTIQSKHTSPDLLTFGIYGRDYSRDKVIQVRKMKSG